MKLDTASDGNYVVEACSWITDQQLYLDWLGTSSKQVLWIRGGPGKGKTFMSIYITFQLEKRVQNRKSGLAIWHLFDTENESNNSAEAAVRSMIWATCKDRLDLRRLVEREDPVR